MNNYKNVLKNLNKETKVELETQKVELALIDDFKQSINQFNRSRLNGQDDLAKALDLAKKSIKTLNVAKKDGENSLKQYKNIIKAAENIGAVIPSPIARAGEQTEDLLKEVDKMLRAAKQINSAI